MINPAIYQAVLKHTDGTFIPVLFWYDREDQYDEGEWYVHDHEFDTVDEAWVVVEELSAKQRLILEEEDNRDCCDSCGNEVFEKPKRILDYDY